MHNATRASADPTNGRASHARLQSRLPVENTDVRRICIMVGSRANYARIKSVVDAVQRSPDLELQLVVGASTLLRL